MPERDSSIQKRSDLISFNSKPTILNILTSTKPILPNYEILHVNGNYCFDFDWLHIQTEI